MFGRTKSSLNPTVDSIYLNILGAQCASINSLEGTIEELTENLAHVLLYRIYSSCINELNIGLYNKTTEALTDINTFKVFKTLLLTGAYEDHKLALYTGVFLEDKVKIKIDTNYFSYSFLWGMRCFCIYQRALANRVAMAGTVIRGLEDLRNITRTLGQSRADEEEIKEAGRKILAALRSNGTEMVDIDSKDSLTMLDSHNNIDTLQELSLNPLVFATGLPATYFNGLIKGGTTSGIALAQQEYEIKRALRDLYTSHFKPILKILDTTMGWNLGNKLNYEQTIIDNIRENLSILEFLNQDMIIPESNKDKILESILGEKIIRTDEIVKAPMVEEDEEEIEE